MKKWTLLVMILSASTTISAQEKRAIDIDEAVKIAMQNNIQVITAQNSYNATVANVLPKTWGNALPTVDLNGRYSLSDQSSPFFTTSGVKNSSESYSYNVTANYVLFDGFKKFVDISQAKTDEKSARYDFEQAKQEVTLQIYQSYVNVLKNQQLLKISEENLKRSEEQLKRLEERNKLGAQILSDVYKQRVQVGSDKLSVNKAKNNLNTSKASLNSLIGIDVRTEITLVELPFDPNAELLKVEFDDAYENALEQRKDYLASRKKVESAQGSLKASKSGYFPVVSAFATYQWNDGFVPKTYKSYTMNDRSSIGINLQIPIFSGFQTNAGVIRANESVQTAKSNLETTKRKVALDIKIALLNMQTSFENVKLSEENVKSAKEDLRLATERYNLGAGTVLDQITANTGYSTAEANYTQSIYDFIYARQQYLLAVGMLSN
ncbi:TolC family protein [bacterium]|nr:TolC family protein [bacterium]